jgi:hypothetical protein
VKGKHSHGKESQMMNDFALYEMSIWWSV